ncbi:hypothetical protein BDZ45DRAFT_687420 [Acephala macrosclerotiorum]|nr:hypothetical protein BDZ45DRAFT_687420 [Acephala macrosclerotiorum]
MVASTPEYHILGKRVAVERLQIGTIIGSIEELVRLNAGKEPKIKDIQPRLFCSHETNFEATREEALKGEAGVALKAFALEGVGGEAKIDAERGNIDKYKFQTLDTLEFDAEKKDYLEGVKATGVQAFLNTSSYSPVYFITGLKTGKNPSIDYTKVRKMGGGIEFGINLGSTMSAGPKTNASKTLTMKQKSDGVSDALIFAIRVRKLKYKKQYLGLFGAKNFVDEGHNVGAEMVGVDKSVGREEEPESIFDVEVVDLEEEMEGYERINEQNKDGETTTWVVPEDW